VSTFTLSLSASFGIQGPPIFVPFVAKSIPSFLAGSTLSSAIRTKNEIVAAVRVPLRAVSFLSIQAAPPAPTPDVLSLRDRLEVEWIYTCPIATQVIKLEVGRDWTNKQSIRKDVCATRRHTVPDGELAVPVAQRTSPNPAG
jgi:hypothetical protein